MKKSRFTHEQFAFALKQAESGVPVEEVCRKLGISQQTFYRWKKKFDEPGEPLSLKKCPANMEGHELKSIRHFRTEPRTDEFLSQKSPIHFSLMQSQAITYLINSSTSLCRSIDASTSSPFPPSSNPFGPTLLIFQTPSLSSQKRIACPQTSLPSASSLRYSSSISLKSLLRDT